LPHVADAGLVLTGGAIGSYVWLDGDQDGIQDPNEGGVPDIPVQLYTAGGSLVATTNTDDDGYYQFSSVAPGNYYVVVIVDPAAFTFTAEHVGSNRNIDSDVNQSGQTDTITLALGDRKLHDADAGLIPHSVVLSMSNFSDAAQLASTRPAAAVPAADAGLRTGQTLELPPLPFAALAVSPPTSASAETLDSVSPEWPEAVRPRTHGWSKDAILVEQPIGDDRGEQPFPAAFPG
jgi:hypothetical protein